MSESTIKLEDGTIQQITVKGPQLNRDGAVLEGARAFITVKVPLDGSGVEAYLGTFTRLIKRDRQIKFIEFRFIEQLELEALKDRSPNNGERVSDPLGTFPKNGHDSARNTATMTEHVQKVELVGSGTTTKRAKK